MYPVYSINYGMLYSKFPSHHVCTHFWYLYAKSSQLISLHDRKLLPIVLDGKVKQLVASIHPSVHLFPLCLLKHLIFELEFLFMYGT